MLAMYALLGASKGCDNFGIREIRSAVPAVGQAMLLRFVVAIGCFAVAIPIASAETPAKTPQVDFGRDIRPLLSDRCFKCHGPDSATREAGLRLDVHDVAVAELDSGMTA